MPIQPALSRDAAMEVKRLYEQRTPAGRRVWSHRDLAKQFGCSETTILRVLRGLGSFMGLPTPAEQDALRAEAAASLAKLRGLLDQPAAPAVTAKADPTGDQDGLTEAARKQLAGDGHSGSS